MKQTLWAVLFAIGLVVAGMGVGSAFASLTFTGTAVTGDGAVSITAGGSNQNVSVTPSGSGYVVLLGNTGVGTSSPAYLLAVATTSNILSASSTGAVGFRNVFYFFPTAQGGASTVLTNDGSGNLTWSGVSAGGSGQWTRSGTTLYPSTSTDSIAIGTTTAATLLSVGTSTNIFNVTTAGRVGIGTSNPGAALEVVSNNTSIRLTNLSGFQRPAIEVSGNNDDLYITGLSYLRLNDSLTSIGDVSDGLVFDSNNGFLFRDSTPIADLAMLTAQGFLGIGTTSPSSTVHVVGASSTLRIGNTTACLEMANSDGSGGVNYITVLNGTLSVTTTKPTACR